MKLIFAKTLFPLCHWEEIKCFTISTSIISCAGCSNKNIPILFKNIVNNEIRTSLNESLKSYTLSHPENDHDVTDRATGCTLWNTRWRHGRSRGETTYREKCQESTWIPAQNLVRICRFSSILIVCIEHTITRINLAPHHKDAARKNLFKNGSLDSSWTSIPIPYLKSYNAVLVCIYIDRLCQKNN